MKRFLLFCTIVLTSLSLLAANAEAKRLGGGGSTGKQRAIPQQQMQRAPAAAPAQATPPQAAAQPQAAGSKWLGPLAGLAIGAGLASLFAGSGLGGGLGAILLVVLAVAAVLFVIALFRRQQRPAPQYAGAGAPYSPPEPAWQQPAAASAQPAAAGSIPADFPVDAFMRSAKTTFIRLQAANDRKDLDDIREYTTPEMFAEISMQMRERGDAPQKTDVVELDARLLEVATEGDHAIASVRFTALLSENGGAAEAVDEIWHVQKNLRDDRAVWLLTGIQQVA